MALQKTINLPSGVSANYIRITKINIDKPQGKLLVMLSLYLDESHKTGNPVMDRPFKMCVLNIAPNEYTDDLFELAYTKIKNQEYPELEGSIDV